MTARTAHEWRFEAIGTTWSLETEGPLPAGLRAQVSHVIDRFDGAWSRFREDSLVARLARSPGCVPSPPDTAAMLALYAELDDATAGAVNPLVGESLARLGYDARYSFVAGDPAPAPTRWRELMRWDDRLLCLSEPSTLDVGALGKGRLVDVVLALLTEHLSGDITVDASGDLAVRGSTQRIGLEHPYRPDQAIGVIEIADAALCASSITRRAWGNGRHHVLDARTGVAVDAYAATWAIAPTAMRADALATALFFPGGAELAAAWGAQWVRMRTDGRVEWSPGCTAELFT